MAEFLHDGQSLHYELIAWDRPCFEIPTLMLHGNGEDMHIFDRALAKLHCPHRLVLMDSRMQGESHFNSIGLSDLSYSAMADDAAALMRHLGIEEYNIVGYSDGGIIGLIMAMRIHGIRRLIAIGANIDPGGLTCEAVDGIRTELARAESAGDVRGEELMRLMLEQPHITPAELSCITAQTTIVLGTNDVLIDRRHCEMIANAIPSASLRFVENAGHDVPSEQPGALARMMDELLAS